MIETLLSPWTLFGALFTLAGGGALAFFFMPQLIFFFTQTSLGRKIAAIGAVVFAIWLVLVRVFAAGRKKERDQLQANSEQKEQERKNLDATLKSLPPDRLVDRSKPWVRD